MTAPTDTLDPIDLRLLSLLQADGRATWASLGEAVGLSAPAVTERVRRLQVAGQIRGFHALLDPARLGLMTLGFIAVSIRDPARHDTLLERINLVPQVQECHVVAGEFDYLLKVRCESPEALAALLRDTIRPLPGIGSTKTILVLETIAESSRLPLPGESPAPSRARKPRKR